MRRPEGLSDPGERLPHQHLRHGCCGTTDVTADTTCTSSGGGVCDGSGKCVGCLTVADCAPETTKCLTNTCTGNACGTDKANSGTTCSDNGGKLCDGNGTCAACLVDTDCPATGTVCATPHCAAGKCSPTDAAKGATAPTTAAPSVTGWANASPRIAATA